MTDFQVDKMISANGDAVSDFVPPKHLRAAHQAILRHFVNTGQAPTTADLALTLARSPVEVEMMIQELATKCLYRDPTSGKILAAYPFSARPTSHRLRLPTGQEIYAMCAIDALGVSAMLDQPVSIHSHCAHCDMPISIEIHGETLVTIQPSSAVVWYQAAPADCVPATAKCPSINFFCQPAHRIAWGEVHSESHGSELTVTTALKRGIKTFGHLLRV